MHGESEYNKIYVIILQLVETMLHHSRLRYYCALYTDPLLQPSSVNRAPTEEFIASITINIDLTST